MICVADTIISDVIFVACLGSFFFCVGEILGVGAFEVFDAAALEVPDARGDFVDHVVVVRYGMCATDRGLSLPQRYSLVG